MAASEASKALPPLFQVLLAGDEAAAAAALASGNGGAGAL